MSVMYLIVPVALLVVGAAVVAYLWAAKHGQFDDLTTPALRVLHDDPETPAGVAHDDRAHAADAATAHDPAPPTDPPGPTA